MDVRVESAGGISDKSAADRFGYAAAATQHPLPSGGNAPAARDTAAPKLTGLHLTHRRFREGSGLPRLARKSPTGTTVRFRLSEPADVRFTFTRMATGRKVGGSFEAKGRAGKNGLRFLGRLDSARALRPGRYRLTVRATDAQGNRSRARRATFVLLAAR